MYWNDYEEHRYNDSGGYTIENGVDRTSRTTYLYNFSFSLDIVLFTYILSMYISDFMKEKQMGFILYK